jgi:prepilin-type N-terminal cleavage/methylation domain-containing protein
MFNAIKKIQSTNKGFTLMEMIVVIALIATISTLVLFNNVKLNSAILTSNTAYEIGLIIREAQVAGLGVTAGVGTQNFNYAHGVHFDMNNKTQAIIFSDTDNNQAYTVGEGTHVYTIENRRAGTIFAICKKESLAPTVSTEPYCRESISVNSLDVFFTRPNPEAFFNVPNNLGIIENYIGAMVINIGVEGDICRSVIVEKTGAVQIDNRYCPPIN